MDAASIPELSVIVSIASDTTRPPDCGHLAPCLDALQRSDSLPLEVIVPHPRGLIGLDALRTRHPKVLFLETGDLRNYSGSGGSREHHCQLISRGLAVARGQIIALIEDHDIVTVQWSTRLVESHRQPIAAVGGAIENGIDRPLNWAVYLCDFGRYQAPLSEGDSHRASDANVSYKRSALEAIRPVWKEEFHEAEVNAALLARGERIALRSEVVVHQHRRGLRFGPALRERFIWGRSFGAWRTRHATLSQRIFWTAFSPGLPLLLTLRIGTTALKRRRAFGAFMRALPLVAALTTAWACGEFTGYTTGRVRPQGSGVSTVV
jgi:hypothetical protein